jgi:2-methylcitrate dehydratase PrpD
LESILVTYLTMSSNATLTDRLVAAALDGYDPDTARRAGSRALFDHLACREAGRREAPTALGAAAAAAWHDRDDVHWPSLTHPGGIVWTVLAAAGADGETRWRAAHAGYEVTCRLARALGPSHRRYWHATTTAGTVGGAVAAAVALDVDPVAAAGHAISITGGSIVALLERSPTRLLHRDHAASTALRCAEAAAALPATRAGLEHPRGLLAAMGDGPSDALLAPAERSALAETSFRRHATSGFAQAVVEAARGHGPVDPEAPGEILVEVPEATLGMAADPAPADAGAAWWSCQHAVAVTLLGLDLEDRSLAGDPRVVAVRDRVTVTEGPVSSVTIGAQRTECAVAAALTDDDLVAKWHVLNPGVAAPAELLA